MSKPVGQMRQVSSAQGKTVQKAAERWHQRDEEERRERRERAKRRGSQSRCKASRNGPVQAVRVRPDVWRVALELAGYDTSRIEIISETEVIVR